MKQNETRVLRGMQLNQEAYLSYIVSSLSPTLFFSLSFPPCTCTCTTPTPPRPWRAGQTVHQRSFLQWVCHHKLLKQPPTSSNIHHSTPSLSSLYTCYMLFKILPSILAKKKKKGSEVSAMLSFTAIIGLAVICICMICVCVCKCMALAVRGQARLISILYPFYNGTLHVIYKGLFVQYIPELNILDRILAPFLPSTFPLPLSC